MKMFDHTGKDPKKTLNKARQQEISLTYEKAGLLPIYREAFQKLHSRMEELKTELLAQGISSEKVKEIVAQREAEGQREIIQQGNQQYLAIVEQVEKGSSGPFGRPAS